jgi:hypothetical protein
MRRVSVSGSSSSTIASHRRRSLSIGTVYLICAARKVPSVRCGEPRRSWLRYCEVDRPQSLGFSLQESPWGKNLLLLPETLYGMGHLPCEILFESCPALWRQESANYAPTPLAQDSDQLNPILTELRAALHEQDTLAKGLIAERTRMLNPNVFRVGNG